MSSCDVHSQPRADNRTSCLEPGTRCAQCLRVERQLILDILDETRAGGGEMLHQASRDVAKRVALRLGESASAERVDEAGGLV
jgi:hypothetical protein